MSIDGFSNEIPALAGIPKGSRFAAIAGAAFAALFLFTFIPCGYGQTNWSVELSTPSFGEYNSPPGSCVGVLPPYALITPPIPPPPCPPLGAFLPVTCRLGGSAFDDNGNIFSGGPAVPAQLHSDGRGIMMTDTAGGFILSMAVGSFLPTGVISGLGYDSLGDIVWVTDGFLAVSLGLAVCPVIPPFIGSTPIPLAAGASASGIDWDPCTGTLWACDCTGMVTNFTVTGGLITSFPAVGLGTELMGLDVNVTNGNVQVTDGIGVAEYTPGGALAPTAFYLSSNPYLVPLWSGFPVSGLGFTLRPQNYGKGCHPTGGTPPSIGFGGSYPYAGNPSFTVTQTGATPASDVYLIFGFTPVCPGLPLAGCPGATIWIFPFFGPNFVGTTTAVGTFSISFSLPAPPAGTPCALPVGLPVYMQFINVTPSFDLELTDALAFTIGAL